MADESYVVELIIDTGSSPASLRALANIVAEFNSGLKDPALTRFEQTLVKMAAAADKAATASKGLSGSQSKTAESTAIASKQAAIYNQYLYDEVKALTGVSLSLDQLTAGNYEAAKGEAQLSAQTAIANKYLYDQEVALTKTAGSLSTTRYALYSASSTIASLSVVLLALSTLPAIVSISFQKEFAQVSRTVQGSSAATEAALISLSQTIPVSFKDLAQIAALGGQLGIKSNGIVQFTKTVAELTATTDLSATAAGTFLGRFEQFFDLDPSQFEKLGSAVLKVGVDSAATESQIVSIATRIAGAGKILNLTAQEVVGLSGALASVGVKPYGASGTITRFAGVIRAAVSQGGSDLETLARVAGVSSEQFTKAFNSGKFSPIFTQLIEGFGDVKKTGGDAANVLRELGLTGTIDAQTFRQLAAAPKTVALAFNDANHSFQTGTTLTNQYGKIAETAASKIKILENSFVALFNSIGSAQTGGVGTLASGLSGVLKLITDLNSMGGGQFFLSAASGLGILLGLVGLSVAGFARGAAGIIGITQAITGLKSEEIVAAGITKSFVEGLRATGATGKAAAVGVNVLRAGVVGLGVAALVAGAYLGATLQSSISNSVSDAVNNRIETTTAALKRLKTAQGSAFDFGSSAALSGGKDTKLSENFSGLPSFLFDINRNLANLGIGFSGTVTDVKKADDAFASLVSSNHVSTANQQIKDLAKSQGISVTELLTKLPSTVSALNAYADAQGSAATGAKVLSGNLGFVNEAVKENNKGLITAATLTKALAELSGDTNFAKDQAAFATAYAKSVSSLTDFNSIIKQVQDAQTAAAQAKADSTKSTKDDSSTYYDGLSVSLDQYTKQLVANNGAQQTWLTNLITIQGKAGDAGPAIVSQLIQAGYSVTNASFLQQLVDATPAQLKAYTDATTTSLNLAGQAAAQQLLAGGFLRDSTGSVIGADLANKIGIALGNGLDVPTIIKLFNLQLTANPLVPKVDTGQAQSVIDNLIRSNSGRSIGLVVKSTVTGPPGISRATGGYISGRGTGTSDSIPARLSNGEYVVRASSVRRYGVGLFDQLNRGVKAFAGGGYVGGGSTASYPTSMIVELSARDRAIIGSNGSSGGSVIVQIDGQQIASAVARVNRKNQGRGSN